MGRKLRWASLPELIFKDHYWLFRTFEAARDGQRFLVATGATDTVVPPFTVVLNWMAELKK